MVLHLLGQSLLDLTTTQCMQDRLRVKTRQLDHSVYTQLACPKRSYDARSVNRTVFLNQNNIFVSSTCETTFQNLTWILFVSREESSNLCYALGCTTSPSLVGSSSIQKRANCILLFVFLTSRYPTKK